MRFLGLVMLAAATVALIGSELGWVPEEFVDSAFRPIVVAAGITLALGILLGVLAPLVRAVTRGRCVRCGSAIEKGQTYCADHLRESVLEAEDKIRGHY